MRQTADYEAQAEQASRLARTAKSDAERRAIEAIEAIWRKLADQRKAGAESQGLDDYGHGS